MTESGQLDFIPSLADISEFFLSVIVAVRDVEREGNTAFFFLQAWTLMYSLYSCVFSSALVKVQPHPLLRVSISRRWLMLVVPRPHDLFLKSSITVLRAAAFLGNLKRVRLVAPLLFARGEPRNISRQLDSYPPDNSKGESYSLFILGDPESKRPTSLVLNVHYMAHVSSHCDPYVSETATERFKPGDVSYAADCYQELGLLK
ncbi:hypothetical protein EDD85DRAFT_783128 [Armillaria nabsnona]|nr:hypothetical protein EDD85DRAFT_783128 [Armillaria nabsnona]